MNDRLSAAAIRQHFPAFVEPALQDALAEHGRVYRFRAGAVIMESGDYVRMLPLVLSGSVKVSRRAEDGAELFLYYLAPGESCTMTFSCCLADKRSDIRALAATDTRLLGLPRRKLDEWLTQFRSWKNFILTAYDQRMAELVSTIDQVAFSRLDERLYEYVVKRADLQADHTILATHQAIAADLNVSREAVSRLLKTMEKRGLITLGRNKIRLLRKA